MTLQHHLQSCGQVWNFGTSQPQHRGVESNGMQGWERRHGKSTNHDAALAQSSQHSSSWRVLLQNLSIDSKDLETRHFVPMCLCTTVQLFMPHALPYQTICWSGAFQRVCLCSLRSAPPRYLGTLLLTSVPSQLLTVAKISSNLLATDVEWIWMNDNKSNSIAMLLIK